ncbi:MAG: hypothetical protein ACRD06_04510 [Terriglobia bacterium]
MQRRNFLFLKQTFWMRAAVTIGVTPAKAGVQLIGWISAFAGMTGYGLWLRQKAAPRYKAGRHGKAHGTHTVPRLEGRACGIDILKSKEHFINGKIRLFVWRR